MIYEIDPELRKGDPALLRFDLFCDGCRWAALGLSLDDVPETCPKCETPLRWHMERENVRNR